MKIVGKMICIICSVFILGILSGCASPEGLKLSSAFIKGMDTQSFQSDSEVTINVKTEGFSFSEEEQQIIDTINSTKVSFNTKSNEEEQKGSMLVGVETSVGNFDGELYTDGQKMWLKIPGEEKYILVDPAQFSQEQMDIYESQLANKEVYPLAVKFVKAYISQYGFDFSNMVNKGQETIVTPEGSKEVTKIEVSLDTQELEEILKYTIENAATSQALEEYVKSVTLIYAKSQPEVTQEEINQAISDIETGFQQIRDNKEQLNTEVEEIIDEMMKYVEVGPEGMVFTFGLDSDNNIITSESKINLVIKNEYEPTQKVNITLNYKTTMYGINTTSVVFPTFKSTNTITLKEYVRNNPTLKESELGAALGVQTKRIYLRIGDEWAYSNGHSSLLDAAPYIQNDTTMVPVRFVGESLGAQISWNDATQAVTYNDGQKVILMTIGSKVAYVNGQAVIMPEAPTMINDRTMVPVRFVSEQFGATVDWNEQYNSVVIEKY